VTVETGDALFHPDGNRFVPSGFARGPWSPDALHGGPVAALVARAVEACPSDEPMHVARLTVELLRPVPLAPLAVTATVSRPGHKVQLVDVRVTAGDRDVVWGRALRIRLLPHTSDDATELAEVAAGLESGNGPGPPAGPADGHRSPAPVGADIAFHSDGAELRYLTGEFGRNGPSIVWVRLAVPLVPAEEPSPLQRVAAASDFGNGVSSVLDYQRYLFINPDLSVHLIRPAVGEWVCLDARTTLGTPGVGMAESLLWDVHGLLGRSLQSLLIERRS
jgi:hypothetical protein